MLRLAVLGHPVAHSLSPAMHRYALESLGLPGRYEAWETPLEALPERLAQVRQGFRGVNLTLPLKEAALPLLDWVAPEARAMGAVNTVLSLEGRLFGFNTDAPGFLAALRAGGIPLVGPALVLGAGGAARAVAYALKGAGLRVWVWNRTPERAQALAEALGLEAVPLERAPEARLLVNATSVGLGDPEATPLPPELFPQEGAAVDLVYRPLWTRFLREARARGLKVQTGLPMLAWQGALAFRIWTGLLPDAAGMERVALKALGED
ncbi:MAG: shikimate dehydrogenase [Thermus sp.]|uniref:shikimate dehydrogenase n=1 Tax=unclassified Thermus TaxID=2619321 RepID=UPI00059BE9CA|nr:MULTISPECIES: shikimate dehydrogenase [unclassified Thermus]MCS6868059.1 shikimate dehydrogenase [Thermus sp.]MCS7217578.1 shikimate dehydrogenase [Thermus sp.]MCX7849430.1 shikimate dehydrogenase [Thermus sp.]MDW8017670.1 shikimate dehydrogenase [Thermus sp.]MDW8356915.1 shikimate dehydrogenase [Thermus sp.]